MLLRTELPPNPADRPDLNAIATLPPPEKIRTPKDDEVDRYVDEGLRAISLGPYMEPRNVPVQASGLVFLDCFHEGDPKKWERSAINMRLSKSAIMDAFEGLVDLWIKERNQFGLKQLKPIGRIRLDKYLVYLKVYDLKATGKTYREIAEELWPNSSRTELDAKRYHAKAQRIIANPPLFGKAPRSQQNVSEKVAK